MNFFVCMSRNDSQAVIYGAKRDKAGGGAAKTLDDAARDRAAKIAKKEQRDRAALDAAANAAADPWSFLGDVAASAAAADGAGGFGAAASGEETVAERRAREDAAVAAAEETLTLLDNFYARAASDAAARGVMDGTDWHPEIVLGPGGVALDVPTPAGAPPPPATIDASAFAPPSPDVDDAARGGAVDSIIDATPTPTTKATAEATRAPRAASPEEAPRDATRAPVPTREGGDADAETGCPILIFDIVVSDRGFDLVLSAIHAHPCAPIRHSVKRSRFR